MNDPNPIRPEQLLARLRDPSFYTHPVSAVELVETHISWIFLAGDFAYKLKKPLDLGFLDFSTLEKRRFYCQEELRLNRRFAPQLYLEVIALGGRGKEIRPGSEPVCEYLVKMKRFPARNQLDRMLADGHLTARHIRMFAERIAEIHAQAPSASVQSGFGTPESIITPALENFTQIRPVLPDGEQLRQIDHLENWCRESSERFRETFEQRRAAGHVRECHGDVHLGNMAWFEEQPLLFDCIEFSENLRWIDTVNDIAFLAMDLDDRKEGLLGWSFLNDYLRASGDYPGTALLAYYQVYRALVRAKVTSLRLTQTGLSRAERQKDQELVHGYLDLAGRYVQPRQPRLVITHGLSGAGKSCLVRQLAPRCKGICVHSDLERKRLHGIPPEGRSDSPVAGGIYSRRSGEQTYRRLTELADGLLATGITTIVDATFLSHSDRQRMARLAERHQVPLTILHFVVPEKELRKRIRIRAKAGKDPSEANEWVLDYQLANAEPLSIAELGRTIRVRPDTPVDLLVREINAEQ